MQLNFIQRQESLHKYYVSTFARYKKKYQTLKCVILNTHLQSNDTY